MYTPNTNRYSQMKYNRCGNSGLLLPAISLGFWHNFGAVDQYGTMVQMVHRAFDRGITHFDLANNYGPPAGEAERNFGKMLREGLHTHRDEMVISSKAGYGMWPGPYGEWGSKKHLMASLHQSLKRMGLEYVDIFYSHRPDPNTPLEETMQTLDLMVRQGKALYVGISSYSPAQTTAAAAILKQLGTPCLIHQPKYSMLARQPEEGLLQVLDQEGIGCIAFSPLAQGLLTSKYLGAVPVGSRVGRGLSNGAIDSAALEPQLLSKIKQLDAIAHARQQTLAQMAIAWLLRTPTITSVLVGASSVQQLDDNIDALNNLPFDLETLEKIDAILGTTE
ncbi:MAG: L-glyceraldehyde 3-phosphate reductase [Bacteroidetes bacterium]|nr:MAG: L-glyceraldehyde 3-phosphate reductase [Bacteroidota bacterium]